MGYSIANLPRVRGKIVRAFEVPIRLFRGSEERIPLRPGMTLTDAANKIGITESHLPALGITAKEIDPVVLRKALEDPQFANIPRVRQSDRRYGTKSEPRFNAVVGRLGSEEVVFGSFNIIEGAMLASNVEGKASYDISKDEAIHLMGSYIRHLGLKTISGAGEFAACLITELADFANKQIGLGVIHFEDIQRNEIYLQEKGVTAHQRVQAIGLLARQIYPDLERQEDFVVSAEQSRRRSGDISPGSFYASVAGVLQTEPESLLRKAFSGNS